MHGLKFLGIHKLVTLDDLIGVKITDGDYISSDFVEQIPPRENRRALIVAQESNKYRLRWKCTNLAAFPYVAVSRERRCLREKVETRTQDTKRPSYSKSGTG